MVDEIVVKANYENPRHVPQIGQRKRMRVNGRFQTMTLTELSAVRRHCYGENGIQHVFEYDTVETWGSYLSGQGIW